MAARSAGRQAGVRWALLVLLALIAVNAVAAGSSFVAEPDGSGLGIPQEWLEDSPFDTYLVPGLLLCGLGVLHATAAVLQWRRTPRAWFWAGLSGSGLLVWILVQAAMMGSTRHPIQTSLQAACLAIGIATGLLALAQRSRPPSARRASTMRST